jgi:hypothetical protein
MSRVAPSDPLARLSGVCLDADDINWQIVRLRAVCCGWTEAVALRMDRSRLLWIVSYQGVPRTHPIL